MDNVFGFKVILRFVLPGLAVLLGVFFLLEAVWILWQGRSFYEYFSLSTLGWPSFFWIASLAFVFGIVINALLFERSFLYFNRKYKAQNPERSAVERQVFDAVEQTLNLNCFPKINTSTTKEYGEKQQREDWYILCRDNRRGIALISDNSGAIEAIRNELAPYIDFQLGLAVGLHCLAFCAGFRIFLSESQLVLGLSGSIILFIVCSILEVVAWILSNSAYRNYRKMRESRLVMLAALVGTSSLVERKLERTLPLTTASDIAEE